MSSRKPHPSRSQSPRQPTLVKVFWMVTAVVVTYFLYWTYQLYEYGEIPINKKDVMLRKAILSRFPAGYEVEIKNADLLGFGDKFLIGYGNREFVGKAFAMDNQAVDRLQQLKGENNRPLVKIFYIAEPGIWSSLLNLNPLLDIQKNIVELSLREYKSIELIPLSEDTKQSSLEQFKEDYAFPSLFSLSDLNVDDIDGDGMDELQLSYLSYAGGSGGTRWSIIYEMKDGELTAHSGYPEMLNISLAKFIQAVSLYSGLDGILPRDESALRNVVHNSADLFSLTSAEQATLLTTPLDPSDILQVFLNLARREPYDLSRFIDLSDQKIIDLPARHTDDYSGFVNIGAQKIFVESFYVDDDACHWCEHRWRLMAYHYDNGRWISDRTINGDSFNGQWLKNAKALTLNDVFGAYHDQGLTGLAWSFVDKRWTASSLHEHDDPLGVGMRTISPVEQWVRKRYRDN